MYKDCTDYYPKHVQNSQEIADAWECLEYFPERQQRHDQILNDLEGAEIHLAYYDTGCYNGSAQVLFEKLGKLYICDAGHCSCYGLEDQWSPTEVTWESLALGSQEDASELARIKLREKNASSN